MTRWGEGEEEEEIVVSAEGRRREGRRREGRGGGREIVVTRHVSINCAVRYYTDGQGIALVRCGKELIPYHYYLFRFLMIRER